MSSHCHCDVMDGQPIGSCCCHDVSDGQPISGCCSHDTTDGQPISGRANNNDGGSKSGITRLRRQRRQRRAGCCSAEVTDKQPMSGHPGRDLTNGQPISGPANNDDGSKRGIARLRVNNEQPISGSYNHDATDGQPISDESDRHPISDDSDGRPIGDGRAQQRRLDALVVSLQRRVEDDGQPKSALAPIQEDEIPPLLGGCSSAGGQPSHLDVLEVVQTVLHHHEWQALQSWKENTKLKVENKMLQQRVKCQEDELRKRTREYDRLMRKLNGLQSEMSVLKKRRLRKSSRNELQLELLLIVQGIAYKQEKILEADKRLLLQDHQVIVSLSDELCEVRNLYHEEKAERCKI